ncbi:MAG: protease inhibitor I42 family protein [Chloroflexi bacterium]|nr:protease inhibitor I42 family protein [Chloroflexota bacterium]
MKKIYALAFLFLAACGSPPDTVIAKYTASDNGKTISLALNQTIAIVLDSNASTGFVWNLTLEPDDKVLDFVTQEYATQGNLPGAGGIETWEFKAVGIGETNLKLEYFRPFEPKNIGKEFALRVQVK